MYAKQSKLLWRTSTPFKDKLFGDAKNHKLTSTFFMFIECNRMDRFIEDYTSHMNTYITMAD